MGLLWCYGLRVGKWLTYYGCRLRAGGVSCPEVVLLKKHVLVMSFIGEDMKPAPQVREVQFSRSQLQSAYQQCIKVLHYNGCTCSE